MIGRRALLLAGLAACAGESAPGERSLPIVNGTFDAADPAVVGLTDGTGDPFCTGTLVSPHVVVAAGHCVTFGAPAFAYFGSDPAAGGMYVPVTTAQAHPDFDINTLVADISVVILENPAPTAPIPMLHRSPVVGENARFVGFGYTEVGPAGQYGKKYETTTAVTSVDTVSFGYGVATCNGDSGGPAFVVDGGVEALAGVTSWGDAACSMFGYDTRVDVYALWVETFILQYDAATCDADGGCAVGCDAPDPDCPCADDGFCTLACSDPAVDPDCADLCGPEGTCADGCLTRDPDCPIIPVGEPCDTDFDCGDNICDGICAQSCDPADPVCAEGTTCLDLGGGRAGCVEIACADGSGDCAKPGCDCSTQGRGGSPVGGILLLALVIALFRPKRAH